DPLPQKGILMARGKVLSSFLAAMLMATLGLQNFSLHQTHEVFPPLSISLASPSAHFGDFIGIAMGFRRLAADIAWIQTLIYYGTPEKGVEEKIAENGGGRYPFFLAYCQRVAALDPYFLYVYYYGAAVLGWNLNRLPEAEEFLQTGIRTHPHEWR